MANTISDELNRLIQAKADIKSALEEKGLTIGDSSTLDEYPALILEMEVGGGNLVDTSALIDMIEGDLTSIDIPNGTKSIRSNCFEPYSNLTNVTIPGTVTTINGYSFMKLKKLTNVTISNGTTYMGDSVFNLCTALTNIILPNTLQTLSNYVFSGCTALARLVIPETVTRIGSNTFNNVSTAMSFALLPSTPPTLSGVIDGAWPIYVKNSVVNTYKTAGSYSYWNNVSTRILPLASMSYDSQTYTVTALGRDNLELYIDGELINSSVYTFTPGVIDTSHVITVTSTDPSLGLLDTSTLEVLVEGAGNPNAMPFLFKVAYNDGREDVTVTDSDTNDDGVLTADEWIDGAYAGTYDTGVNLYISQIWIGDETLYVGDVTNSSYYDALKDPAVKFIKGTTSKKMNCLKVVVGPNVLGITPAVLNNAFGAATDPAALIFLGTTPPDTSMTITNFKPNENRKIYVPDESLQAYIDSSIGMNIYGWAPGDTSRGELFVGLSDYPVATFGAIIDKVPTVSE